MIMGMCIGCSPYNAEQSVIMQAIAVLRRYGQDAHIYLPGVGMLNGLQAGNYLDSAGTTPGTVDQPVGLVLDAAGGLGVELVVPANWAAPASGISTNTTIGSVAFDGTQADAALFVVGGTLVIGAVYKVRYTVSLTAGQYRIRQNSGGDSFTSTSGVIERFYTAINTSGMHIQSDLAAAKFVGSVSNISVREVTGIAASQPTTANKSVLKLTNGRYNWLFDSTDLLTATYPAGYESVTVIDARSTGQVTTAGANIVGAYSMGPSVTLYGRMIVKGTLSASDLALLQGFANRLAGL